MAGTFFQLKTNTITPDLKAKLAAVKRPRSVYEAGAKVVQVELKKHMQRLQARGNANGWPSQGFFARGRNSVEKNIGIAELSDKGAAVTIADPRFVHRIEGGTVSAVRRKFLAIPLRAEAYALQGKGSIRESAPFLSFRRAGGRAFLVRETKTATEFWFLLVRSVTHRPHPEEAPDAAALSASAAKGMERAADLLLGARR